MYKTRMQSTIDRMVTISGREPDWDAIIDECRAEMLAELESPQLCACCDRMGVAGREIEGQWQWLCGQCCQEAMAE